MTCDSGLCTSGKNESKQEWRHPCVSIAKGMKSSSSVHSTYDYVFS